MSSILSDEGIRILQKKSRERTVRTQNIEYDISTLIKRIDDGVIKLDPDYQRNHRWSYEKSSKLIESLILNIPIPVIYISYDVDLDDPTENERYSVIDGQQRLRAITGFLSDEYKIEGLETLNEINGLDYNNMPDFLKRRLAARTVRVLQIDSTIDEQIKYDIFERLNIGSVKLEPQELRNATIRGIANETLKELSYDENFSLLLQIDQKLRFENKRVKKMEDRELVLRFIAFSMGIEDIDSRNLTSILNERMKDINNLSTEEIETIRFQFKEVMRIVKLEFGDTAYAKLKFTSTGKQYASRFNVAVYDALSQAVLFYLKTGRTEYTLEQKKGYERLFLDREFNTSISEGTNLKSRIHFRIEAVKEALS
jgi:Protein of unknown function DUF262